MIRVDDRLLDPKTLEAQGARALGDPAALAGASVAVCAPDAADWLGLFFALRAAGAGVLPIHPATPREAARRLALQAGCSRLVFHGEAEALSPETARGGGVLLQMSSGTTGAPKCIARGWDEIERELASYVAAFPDTNDMTPVVACPTTHSYGLICGLLAGLKRGRTPVLVDPSNPKALIRALRETERSVLYASPAVLHTLAQLLPAGETLHAAMTSGTLLPEAWFARIRARSRRLFQQYGCSEAGVIAVNPELESPELMGRPLPHLSVAAGTGPETPAEIMVTAGGRRIETRDLGWMTPEGMLGFAARLDDTINVSGLNVYPQEVEDVVMTLPAVTDAVAFRLADRFAGERVGLVFSAREAVPPRDVMDWCRKALAGHQLPAQVAQLDAVPRQANGKVSRREIAALFARGELRIREEPR